VTVSMVGTPEWYSGVLGSIRAVLSKYFSCCKLVQEDYIVPAVHQDNISANVAVSTFPFS
jgi:hypothetical protein